MGKCFFLQRLGKRRFFMIGIFLSLFLLFFFSLPVFSQEKEDRESQTTIPESELYARSAVLMDAGSGRVLYEKNADEIMPMASTTKIMTLIVTLENADLEDTVEVSAYAASMPDVQLNIRKGEQYRLKDLLYSLMLESHNDSAVAIAEHVGGSVEGFAEMMNKKAKEIGCNDTCFITPNGLDATATIRESDGSTREVFHSTTAKDLAAIMSYCITRSPKKAEFLEITSTQEYSFTSLSGKRSFSCRNHNAFLNMMEGAISGKTGFTGKAGYCYVGALKRDDRTYVVALLACGWPNNKTYKWKDTKKLMNYGLEEYNYCSLDDVKQDLVSDRIKVTQGKTKHLGEEAYANVWIKQIYSVGNRVLIRSDEKMEVEVKMEKERRAPVFMDEKVGSIRYLINGELLWEYEILTAQEILEIDYQWCLEQIFRYWIGQNRTQRFDISLHNLFTQ